MPIQILRVTSVTTPTFRSLCACPTWENLNAVFINEGVPQTERLAKLNTIAISQMKVLTEDHRMLQFDEAERNKIIKIKNPVQ